MEKQSTRKFLKLIVALVALFLLGASALMLASCNKDEHQHSYTSSVTTPATCSNPGVETFTCSCGLTYTQIIPATGDHDWQVLQVYPNSCESDGYTVYECSVCHEQKQGDWTPKLDHQYVLVEDESSEATCTEAGYRKYECSYCKSRYTDNQYTAQHPALGHSFAANTDEKETISDAVAQALGYVDGTAAKKAGWSLKTAANCTENAVYERVCTRCNTPFTETIANTATGHKVTGQDAGETLAEALADLNNGAVCKINPGLVDAEGNAIYAFECVNENCPVNVQINAAGDTKHYVEAVAHTYTNADGSEVEWTAVPGQVADCDTAGKEQRACTVCDTPETRDVAALGHKYNTVQMDGKTATLVCDADDILSDQSKGLAEAAKVLRADCETTAEYTQRYALLAAAYAKFFDENGDDAKIAYFCVRCYEFVEATEHSWVYAALEDGKYGINDYEKDENGKPVKADITADEFTCQYVEVCENCGTARQKGEHGEITKATCRSGGYCTLCGEQRTAQLLHSYIDVDKLLNEDTTNGGHADGETYSATLKYNDKTFTYGDLRTAYEKVSATETWMVPAKGDCDEPGKSVGICVLCLLDAANGDEFDWAPEEVDTQAKYNNAIKAPTTQNSVCAVVYEFDAGHDYQLAYFTTDAKAATDGYVNGSQTAGRVLWENTNCTFGFKTAYICAKCGNIYYNVPVADDPDTDEVESKVNKEDRGYTTAEGFLLEDGAVKVSDTDMAKADEFDAEDLADALAKVDTNKHDAHAVYVTDDYQTTNGYLASTCVSKAMIAYSCQNCGRITVVEYSDSYTPAFESLKEGSYNEDTDKLTLMNGTVVTTANTIKDADKKYDADNHAGNEFACGEHCDAYVVVDEAGTREYCAAFAGDADNTDRADATEVEGKLTTTYHATVDIIYELRAEDEFYVDGYTLKLAEVDEDAIVPDKKANADDTQTYSIDWTKAELLDSDKASNCSNNGNAALYKLPMSYAGDKQTTKQDEGTYLVFVGEDGKIYPLVNFSIYPDTTTTTAVGTNGSEITVAKSDKFFVELSAENGRPEGMPTIATDGASLALAITNATYSTTEKAYVVTFGEGAQISLDTDTDKDELTALTNAFAALAATMGSDAATNADALVFDFNGGSFKLTSRVRLDNVAFQGLDKLTVKDGTLNLVGKQAAGVVEDKFAIALTSYDDVGSKAVECGDVVFDNVDIVTNKSGIYVDPAIEGSLTLKNGTTLTSYGTYGIYVDAPYATTSTRTTALVTVDNSTVNMTKALPTETTLFSTALYVGAPVAVSVKNNSELSASGQVVVVRAGNVDLTNVKLTLVAGITDATVNADNFSTLFTQNLGITAPNFTGDGALAGYASGLTFQDYRNAGLWGDGNDVSRGVIVIGNSGTTTYQAATHLSMAGVTIVNNTTGANAVADFVIASHYAEDSMYTTTGSGDTATKTLKTMVSVTCSDNASLIQNVVITSNSIAKSVSINNVAR